MLINILKAVVAIVSICNPRVIFLSKITPRYFTWFTKETCRPFNVRKASTRRSWPESYPRLSLYSSIHAMIPLR
jgi:hypothetical protein